MNANELLAHVSKSGAQISIQDGRLSVKAPTGALSDEVWSELQVHRDQIYDLLASVHETPASQVALTAEARPSDIPLSYAQQVLWAHDCLGQSGGAYNLAHATLLKGALNYCALEQALNVIVQRHENLRTRFVDSGGDPIQVIEQAVHMHVPVEDLSTLGGAEQEAQVRSVLRHEGSRGFDLGRAPLLRVMLMKLRDDEHILLSTTHHIVSDGWSEAVLNRELAALYGAYRDGLENPLPPLPLQYADFALWQRKRLQAGELDPGLKYWKKQLAGIPEWLALPTDRPRRAVQRFQAEEVQVSVPSETTDALGRLSRDTKSTLYMTLLAALAVLLARYSGQDDIVISSPIANRQDPRLEALIGFFVNPLLLRVRVRRNVTFLELLKDVSRTALEAYRHQDVPYHRIIEEVSPHRRSPSAVVFDLQNAPRIERHLGDLKTSWVAGGPLTVHADIEVHAREYDGGIRMGWVYDSDLFDRWRMEQMAKHYLRVLEQVSADPDIPLNKLALLAKSERQIIVDDFNRTERPVLMQTNPVLFEEVVEQTPDAVALADRDRHITYTVLNSQANRLAHALRRRGIGLEDVVALFVDRSLEMVVAFWGISKAGAAYLPLDPTDPSERIRSIVAIARPAMVLTNTPMNIDLPNGCPRMWIQDLSVTEGGSAITANPNDQVRRLRLNNAAYVICTSGSTGEPKAVVVTHAGIASLAGAFRERVALRSGSRALQLAPPNFDLAVFEIIVVHLSGGTLVVLETTTYTGDELLDRLCEHAITYMAVVPSRLSELPYLANLPLDALSIGGEPCPEHLVTTWSEGRRLINGYGQTETTVSVTASEPLSTKTGCPIGKPVWNTRTYLLDHDLEPVPVGVRGELYIAGPLLARGYLQQPALTAERFVANPFSESGERMYRTGDLATCRPDGNLEFNGRVDNQVKIRGFRVELAEIEAAVRRVAMINDVVVTLGGEDMQNQLIAYIVPREGEFVNVAEVRAALAEVLPEHMVPTAVTVLAALPLTPSGKVDRKALPKPSATQGVPYRQPQTQTEQILCSVFAEVLGAERVGLDDNFFELGGYSLTAVKLASLVRAKLEIDLAIHILYECPTVAELCVRLVHRTPESSPPH